MARTTASPSIPRFLARVGIHSRGTEILFLAVALYGAFEWYLQRHSETALYVTLFSIPFAAGTGLITIAKAGQLDLLIGAGASRFSIWLSAMVRSRELFFRMI